MEPDTDVLWNAVRYLEIEGRQIPHYMDRQGEAISLGRWADLRQDPEYRTVADDMIGSKRIYTLWMGAVSDPFEDPPAIFGTATFVEGQMIGEVETATEAEALASHQKAVDDARAQTH